MIQEVLAHITGMVSKIEKQPGQQVAAGEAVLILESMKMEMPVEAPASGTVTSIEVKEGDSVTEGAIVARLG